MIAGSHDRFNVGSVEREKRAAIAEFREKAAEIPRFGKN